MGISVTTVKIRQSGQDMPLNERLESLVGPARAEGDYLRLSNRDAWFLDAALEQLDPELPRLIFSQGVATINDAPGDLGPDEVKRIAAAIEEASPAALTAAVFEAYAPIDGDDPVPGLSLLHQIAVFCRKTAAGGETLSVR